MLSKLLDTMTMKALGNLFNSAAKTEILRALHHQPEAVGLRHLARIADVHVRSAELALADLVRMRLVTRRRRSHRVFYALKRTHPDAVLLSAVFDAAAQASISATRTFLNKRAKRILPFIRQANRMLKHARMDST